MSDEYNIESKEVTETKTFVTINGEELLATKVHKFITELEGTDGFMTKVRWSHKYEKIAEAMIEEGLVNKDIRGSWYARNEERLEELKKQLEDVFYDS